MIENERTTYRILSKSVREYHFIVPYDSYQDRVEVGQMSSIRDRDLTFLARILNIEHSSNYDGHWDTTMRGTQFYDDDQIFNRVIAEPLGLRILGRASGRPGPLPTKFSPVERAEKEEFGFLKSAMGDIEVGYLRNGSILVEDIPVSFAQQCHGPSYGRFLPPPAWENPIL